MNHFETLSNLFAWYAIPENTSKELTRKTIENTLESINLDAFSRGYEKGYRDGTDMALDRLKINLEKQKL